MQADFRHVAKHVALGDRAGATEITVSTILSWPAGPDPDDDAPRAGRELRMFHISRAFVQTVRLIDDDCDIHFEISDTANADAPRAIVETPVEDSYCTARQTIQAQLADHHFRLSRAGGVVQPALAVEVFGLAFRDHPGLRGSVQVETLWELHPAVVTVLP